MNLSNPFKAHVMWTRDWQEAHYDELGVSGRSFADNVRKGMSAETALGIWLDKNFEQWRTAAGREGREKLKANSTSFERFLFCVAREDHDLSEVEAWEIKQAEAAREAGELH